MSQKLDNNFEILLLDDEDELLQHISENLTKNQMKHSCFHNAHDLLEYLKSNITNVLLIVSDYKLPEKDGLNLKEELNTFPEDIPFVMMTGFYNKEMALKGMELGISTFLKKPFKMAELIEAITKFSEKRKKKLLEDREMISDFLVDINPMVEDLEHSMLSLEINPNDSTEINKCMRILHTIKGTAACVGLSNMSTFVHFIEDQMSPIAKGQAELDTEKVNSFILAVDLLKNGINQTQNTYNDDLINLEELKKIFSSKNPAKTTQKSKNTPTAPISSNVKEEQDETINIPLKTLDLFMEEISEIVVLRNILRKIFEKKKASSSNTKDFEAIEGLLQELNDKVSKVQKSMSELRKQPLSSIFRTFQRVVRDASRQYSKVVLFEHLGGGIRVDSRIVKGLSNSLIHMIRNSVSHGIEQPEQRKSVGKNEEGIIKISAEDKGHSLSIKIIDDGTGLDPEKILNKAIEKGFCDEDNIKSLPPQEVFQLIFRPGFSTAAKVDNFSGRGVGMDMVNNALEEINGKVVIDSQLGSGTCFTLSIPYPKSTDILMSLIVEINNEHFVFPIDDVIKVGSINLENCLKDIGGGQFIEYKEKLLSLITPEKLLKKSSSKNALDHYVILRSEYTYFAIAVDLIINLEEVVQKNVPTLLKNINIFSGVILLDDESLCLSFSSKGIIGEHRLQPNRDLHNTVLELELAQLPNDELIDCLVFIDHSKQHVLLPQNFILRLLILPNSEVEKVIDYYAIRFNQQSIPLFYLKNGILKKASPEILEEKEIKIVLMGERGLIFALVIVHFVDINKFSFDAAIEDALQDKNSCLHGAICQDQKIYSILDFYKIKSCMTLPKASIQKSELLKQYA